jgi:F-type H+-transporting ATPase subunit delta
MGFGVVLVADISSKNNLVATRYAAALLDMAEEAGLTEKVEKDFVDLSAMLAASDALRLVTASPLASRAAQADALTAIAAKAGFQKLTANFLGVLAQNRRVPALDAVIRAFNRELKKRRGIIEAKVESAFALTPAQTKALQDQIAQGLGSKVTLDVSVNKDLLGGMVVTVGSRMIDDSVRRKLERLGRSMGAHPAKAAV